MARLSISQFAANFEKSWMKAVWITPSDAAAPLRRLSRSSRSPRCDLGAGGGERLGARIRASETEHLMARADELLNNGGTDKACSTGDEDTHRNFSLTSFHGRIRGRVVIEIGD